MGNEAYRYCFCADCIRCGCGMWEKHHETADEIITLEARIDEEK